MMFTECRPTHIHVERLFYRFSLASQVHPLRFLPNISRQGFLPLHNYIVTISKSTRLVISRHYPATSFLYQRATSTRLPLHRQASSTITLSITSGYEPKHFLLLTT